MSAKRTIRHKGNVHMAPEMWCFGLLEHFDGKQLTALMAPRPAEVTDTSKRAKAELFGLESWRVLFDGKPDLKAENNRLAERR